MKGLKYTPIPRNTVSLTNSQKLVLFLLKKVSAFFIYYPFYRSGGVSNPILRSYSLPFLCNINHLTYLLMTIINPLK